MKSTCLSLVAILAVTGCSSYVGPETVAMLGDAPASSGGKYSTGGGISVAADMRERGGQTLICGVWAQSEQQSILTKGRAGEVLARGSVQLDGSQIAQDLSFMQEVPPVADYSGSTANCRQIDRPWQAGDENRSLSIRIPRHVVHREFDGVGGGVIVFFDPGGPGAGGV